MIVWRVEDEEGVGMHRKLVADYDEDELIIPSAFNMATHFDWCAYDTDLRAHTPPDEDEQLMAALGARPIDGFLFGFSSAKQMRDWLYKDAWILRLDAFGMRVAKYWLEPEEVVVGSTQVLIPVGKKALQTHGIAEYFGMARPNHEEFCE